MTPSNGYTRGNGFSVKANGTTLTSNNGVYTISNINANQTVSVSGIVKSQNTGGGTLPAAPAITTTTLAAATMGKEYRQQITATGRHADHLVLQRHAARRHDARGQHRYSLRARPRRKAPSASP